MNVRSSLFVILAIFALPAMAVEPDNRFQAGVGVVNVTAGGSPIDVGANARLGGSLVYVRNTTEYLPKSEVALALTRQEHTLNMGGGTLGGGVDSTTASATIRYRIVEEGDASFATSYVGAGGHMTNFSAGSYQWGALKTATATMAGAVLEIGARIPLGNKKYYIDGNARQYFGSTGKMRLETTVGNALATNVDFKDMSTFMLSFGGTF